VPALRETGVRQLAFLVLSHEDSDHCGAAEAVVREIPVGTVIVPAGFGGSPLARSVLAACRDRGVPVRGVVAGDRLAAGGLDAVALHPAVPAARGAENADSLVLHVRAAGPVPLDLLLTGDVEGPALQALARSADVPPARVLVLPHHGRGVPWPHERLAASAAAEVLVASASEPATVAVRSAWVTGACGAVRVRAGRAPEAWPWEER
jgi:competence protein ComEC